jgi:riboflavin kinase / FMN adenylyltransferase
VNVIRDAARCPAPADGTVVTIGAYDGVHRGHLAVIDEVRRLAAGRSMASAVVTFDRHPAAVVRPESAPKLLTDLEQKLELLDAAAVEHCLVIHFDEPRSKEPAEAFVSEVLLGCLNAKAIVVGEDFHFGHRRRGNVALLRSLGAELGFDVVGMALVDVPGTGRASSTAIRTALTDGDLATANELLGRPHEVRGTVLRGDGRGREWGFPTANIAVPTEICLPADGIYAGWYERPDGAAHPAAISLGRRPQVYEHQPESLLEAHLLDFEADLYGEAAKVRFVARLRAEAKFKSVEALLDQMRRDCDEARTVLGVPGSA